jgi:hypothetical protein
VTGRRERCGDLSGPRVTLPCVATRTAWADIYEDLRERELSELSPEQLETFADAAWWTSRVDEAIAVRQKAYAGYAAGGHARRAAYSAWFLFWDHVFRGEEAIANGWLRRAQRSGSSAAAARGSRRGGSPKASATWTRQCAR